MTSSCKLNLKLLIANNNYKGCGYSLINWGEAPTDEKVGSVSVCLRLSHVIGTNVSGRK